MSDLESVNKHLEELRKRLLRIVLVIGVITMVLLTCHAEPIEIGEVTLYYPLLEPQNNIAAQITNHMKQNLVPEGVQLIQTAPGQAFFCSIVCFSSCRNGSWNASYYQRVCRIYQTSIKGK